MIMFIFCLGWTTTNIPLNYRHLTDQGSLCWWSKACLHRGVGELIEWFCLLNGKFTDLAVYLLGGGGSGVRSAETQNFGTAYGMRLAFVVFITPPFCTQWKYEIWFHSVSQARRIPLEGETGQTCFPHDEEEEESGNMSRNFSSVSVSQQNVDWNKKCDRVSKECCQQEKWRWILPRKPIYIIF